jgi:hypothetical protein
MTCTKNQIVTLTNAALEGRADHVGRAKVLSVIEMDGEPGFRRVHLDRALAGSRWHLESDLEAAS